VTKVDKSEIDAQIAASIKNFSMRAKDEVARQKSSIEMPEFIRVKAQMISAHFILPADARIIDMGCETGEVTYMLAVLNPRVQVIGVDSRTEAIDFARRTYKLPNLLFQVSDISIPDFEDESVDGIINSNILHHVYSVAGHDPGAIAELIEKQTRKLKTGGTMLVRDYVMPPEGEMVFLELPNTPSIGADIASLSDADLLVSFSQNARPMESGCEGFFIEEQMPRREGTRLFRLPHKWAIEFVHRKNYRDSWEQELQEEYTFFTWQDYRRELMRLGLRMVFSAPYWNPWVVKNCFKGRFQLYNENYEPQDPPATNHFIVAQKVADKQSLALEERRPSQQPVGDLQIMLVRDKKSGVLHELVKRPGEYCDIVPYRVTSDNRIVIYVRSGYPRPIVNAVQRGSPNLDGKKWSGHLIEPITMETVEMTDDVEANRQAIFEYVRNYAGLRPKSEESWYVGDTYFPSPDRIDEAIEPVFIEVENPQKTSWPIAADKDVRFTEIGTIVEIDATDITLASQVGLLPEPRLEMHVFELMSRNGIALPGWIGEEMPKIPGQTVKTYSPEDLLKEAEAADFEEVKGAPATLKAVKSVFVEEGRVGKAARGLSAQDIEFIVTEDGTENIAIVIPLSRDWDNNLLVALDPRILPVPNRLGGDGAMLNAPSFVLPKNVKSVQDAKIWIAQQFQVSPEQVGQLGESYFTHTGVTPQRVYPFFVVAPGDHGTGPKWRYTPLKSLWGLLGFARYAGQLIKALARIQRMIPDEHGMAMSRSPVNMRYKDFELSTEKIAVEAKNAGYSAPSRVLGQRGAFSSAAGGTAIAKQNEAAQQLIENLMMPRLGKRLMQSYAEALNLKDGHYDISLAQTLSVQEIDKNIGELSDRLKKSKDSRSDDLSSLPAPRQK
jgi:SAM-dependent methyltransferase